MDKHSATFFGRSLYTFADSENILHVYYITDQELKLRDGKTVSGVLCFFFSFAGSRGGSFHTERVDPKNRTIFVKHSQPVLLVRRKNSMCF